MPRKPARLRVMNLHRRLFAHLRALDVDEIDIVRSGVDDRPEEGLVRDLAVELGPSAGGVRSCGAWGGGCLLRVYGLSHRRPPPPSPPPSPRARAQKNFPLMFPGDHCRSGARPQRARPRPPSPTALPCTSDANPGLPADSPRYFHPPGRTAAASALPASRYSSALRARQPGLALLPTAH
jgi:hypothetical protein